MNKKFVLLLAVLIVLVFPLLTFGKIGVGVGTGKIQMDESLKPGSIYTIPPITVFNTGDEGSSYQINIEGKVNIPEMIARQEWFVFEPNKFYLEPGQSQLVQTQIVLPVKGVKPGDYFAFLTASPVQEFEGGKTSIGVAAATKLYFTVIPANIFQGMYYRFISLYDKYHPWTTIILVIVFLSTLIAVFRKKFKIEIAKK
jgi:hypothetical protein